VPPAARQGAILPPTRCLLNVQAAWQPAPFLAPLDAEPYDALPAVLIVLLDLWRNGIEGRGPGPPTGMPRRPRVARSGLFLAGLVNLLLKRWACDLLMCRRCASHGCEPSQEKRKE
jgi:hypothetical protein